MFFEIGNFWPPRPKVSGFENFVWGTHKMCPDKKTIHSTEGAAA
jgi:hypothetical protein